MSLPWKGPDMSWFGESKGEQLAREAEEYLKKQAKKRKEEDEEGDDE